MYHNEQMYEFGYLVSEIEPKSLGTRPASLEAVSKHRAWLDGRGEV